MSRPRRPAAALEVDDLRAGYDRTEVLHGVSLQAGAGECIAIIGRNGAGKSTLLSAIAGFVRVSGGRVVLDQRDVTKIKGHARVRLGLASSMEGHRVFHPLSVKDNLEVAAFGGRIKGSEMRDEMSRVFDLFPILAQRSSQKAGTLSGGQQQMLAIAQSLMTRPSLLLLDEPSAGLAPKLVDELFAGLSRLATDRTLTLVIVEQVVADVLRIADRGYVLNLGQVAMQANASDLACDPEVVRAYIGQGVTTP